VQDLFDPQDPWAHYITNALKAKELFVKDVNYIVRDDEAVIVDEFTGRVMPQSPDVDHHSIADQASHDR
jgi:preprotein translocase subunit SecA